MFIVLAYYSQDIIEEGPLEISDFNHYQAFIIYLCKINRLIPSLQNEGVCFYYYDADPDRFVNQVRFKYEKLIITLADCVKACDEEQFNLQYEQFLSDTAFSMSYQLDIDEMVEDSGPGQFQVFEHKEYRDKTDDGLYIYPVVTAGRLSSPIFTGFADDDRYSEYPVFTFENGEQWQQDEPYYYYYGTWFRPYARVIKYGENHFIVVDAIPEEINPILPRPVKVKKVESQER